MIDTKTAPKDKLVLVVDDDDLIVALFQEALSQEGFQMEAAFEGSGVIAKIKEKKVDLIILDLMLPNYGGYEILKKLQEDYTTKSIPVIIITAKKLDAQSKQGLTSETNVVDFMEKPLNVNILMSKIHQTLNTISREEKILQQKRKESGEVETMEENKKKLWEF